MPIINDSLSLEYKLKNGYARGNLNLADVVNNPVRQGIVWISGYSLQEESLDFLGLKIGPFNHNFPNPLLVSVQFGT